ncbi:hypothetical protein L0664_02630 [Octadecabacter sp. G9-8]|uniref:Lipocalin/cytosolic fatty-acid binding domain-containing protein n=1 Tax=Octadecabacter dasysiphoniae TaxID=2909341 RepID=A0ABS9CRU3_9RHOB|nr:hypothetical protein [Octadecabacter dasysiphoniae]MCF2869952.1 hypothetical protein [Octadecabacter dasysiphoniae]
MIRILTALMILALAACTGAPDIVEPRPVFRDTDAQIASQTDVTAQRMAGEWIIRQRVPAADGPVSAMTLAALPAGALQLSLLGGDCVEDVCFEEEALVLLTPTGPGRWTPVNPPAGWPAQEIWVMWMDFDSRTAAIGTPSGEFGWIMDKNLTGGGDRITAARDIMEWFGYNMDQLNEVVR